jgi:anti-sigma factor RsiW
MTCKDISDLEPLYLSQELAGDPARAARFEAHLAECESWARAMEQQAELDRYLRDGIRAESMEQSDVENRIRARISLMPAQPSERRWRMAMWMAAAAAVAAVLVMGTFGSRVLLIRPSNPLCNDAANDHRDEVVNGGRRAWRTTVPEIQVLADRPGVGVPLAAPPGYHLDRGKLCRLEGHVYLHLVYSNGTQEFSLFLRHRGAELPPGPARDTANGRPLYTADRGHEHIAFLQTDGITAVIVTDQSSQAALSLARFAASTL